jgi:hypothetical protein
MTNPIPFPTPLADHRALYRAFRAGEATGFEIIILLAKLITDALRAGDPDSEDVFFAEAMLKHLAHMI